MQNGCPDGVHCTHTQAVEQSFTMHTA